MKNQDYQIRVYRVINGSEGWHWINASKSSYYRKPIDQRRIK